MESYRQPIDIRFEIRVNATHAGWARQEYDRIFQVRGSELRHRDSFYRWILKQLQPSRGSQLLDIACGEGVLVRLAAQHYALHAVGTDISIAGLKIAAEDGSPRLAASSAELLPFAENSFDYVTCIGSLEHFHDPLAGVAEMARVLKPGGIACILVPNTYSLFNNIYNAFKYGRSTIDSQPLQRYAARLEWELLLHDGGLDVVRYFKWDREWPSSLSDTFWMLRHWREAIKALAAPFVPLNLAHHIGFLCRPSKGVLL
jgi:SAM-dependent methyltransferase